jgi:chromosome segregation ATPase
MTTNPSTTVSYTLEEILDRFEQKMDRQFTEVNQQLVEINQKLNKLEIGQVELSGEIKTLDEKVSSIDKRLDNQKFINREVLVALIVALL